jgi:hypothetical protein
MMTGMLWTVQSFERRGRALIQAQSWISPRESKKNYKKLKPDIQSPKEIRIGTNKVHVLTLSLQQPD